MIAKTKSNLIMAFVASLTLGLAPFAPEPHIMGKLRWVAGGGVGMQAMDYFDLLMHGLPWLLLIIFSIQFIIQKKKKNGRHSDNIERV